MRFKGTSDGVRTIWATYSDDDGWAEPTLICRNTGSDDQVDAGPGVGIQLRLGALPLDHPT